MNRYNIFYQVHKGLRALLFETALFLQRADFTRDDEIASVHEKITELVHLFDKHAHTEDHLILPVIEAYEPSVVDAFENEHKEDIELSIRLKNNLSGLLEANSNYDKIQFGKSLNLLFIEFTIFNLAHMAKEETILNKLLWRYYSDEELLQFTKKIVGCQKPEDGEKVSRWMLKGLNNNEIVSWLKNVKNNAPDFAFLALMNQANEELNEQRWMQVQERLAEGLLLA